MGVCGDLRSASRGLGCAFLGALMSERIMVRGDEIVSVPISKEAQDAWETWLKAYFYRARRVLESHGVDPARVLMPEIPQLREVLFELDPKPSDSRSSDG